MPQQQPMDAAPQGETQMDDAIPQDNGEEQNFGGEEENPFDGNFDAGVEADEDEDPKKFIQQLTGKLSQTLNQYTNENGEDEELSKYVGKMIAKAAAKGLDEKGRKELIKSINTAEEPDEEEIPEDDTEADGGEQEEPMMEAKFTKKELLDLKSCKKTSPFDGKKFDK